MNHCFVVGPSSIGRQLIWASSVQIAVFEIDSYVDKNSLASSVSWLKGVSPDCGKKFGRVFVGVVVIFTAKNHGGMTNNGEGVGVTTGVGIGIWK
jgi:hypothetical protein